MKKRLLAITIACCASLAFVIALSFFSLNRFETYTSYNELVNHTNKVINNLYKTEVHLKDLDRAERGYLLTHDTAYLRFVNMSIDSLRPSIRILDSLVNDNPEQLQNLTTLKSSVALRINYAREDIDHIDSAGSTVPSSYYHDGRKTMRESVQTLRAMQMVERNLLGERFSKQLFYRSLTNSTLRYLLAFFCLLTLGLLLLVLKELRTRLRFQQELQARVVDLSRSNKELEEIAYAASHDLQEPLRKIQIFTSMLTLQKPAGLDTKTVELLERVNTSAARMQELITALMSLTSLNRPGDPKEPVDMGVTLHFLLSDIEEQVDKLDATMNVAPLPVIAGYPNQLKLLLAAMLDNALKFRRDGVKPVITIAYEVADGEELVTINPDLRKRKFHKVTVEDNGIGFDNKFSEKMFQLYRTVHAATEGGASMGTGLAVCRRIMSNHDGYIIGRGIPGSGARFSLFFPVSE